DLNHDTQPNRGAAASSPPTSHLGTSSRCKTNFTPKSTCSFEKNLTRAFNGSCAEPPGRKLAYCSRLNGPMRIPTRDCWSQISSPTTTPSPSLSESFSSSDMLHCADGSRRYHAPANCSTSTGTSKYPFRISSSASAERACAPTSAA